MKLKRKEFHKHSHKNHPKFSYFQYLQVNIIEFEILIGTKQKIRPNE